MMGIIVADLVTLSFPFCVEIYMCVDSLYRVILVIMLSVSSAYAYVITNLTYVCQTLKIC